nr:uncharacterized protein LOC123758507 [Procambarus clarkii]
MYGPICRPRRQGGRTHLFLPPPPRRYTRRSSLISGSAPTCFTRVSTFFFLIASVFAEFTKSGNGANWALCAIRQVVDHSSSLSSVSVSEWTTPDGSAENPKNPLMTPPPAG